MSKLARKGTNSSKRSGQAGLTLIELMIAIVVLAVGLGGVMIMMTTAIAGNHRSRVDTSGTMLAQMVVEKIAAKGAISSTAISLADCRPASLGGPQSLSLSTAGGASPSGAGAQLGSAGEIDFTQAAAAVTSGYQMTYYTCGVNNRQVAYDVRWNVMTMTTISGTTYTKMVTVSARQLGFVGGTYQARLFAPPITLRSIVGQ